MPKVSEQHLEARRQQIVDAAFQCFARKGFHPTTMQDICAEADLSAGTLYRYFASKEEIIASACSESQNATDVELLNEALAEPDTRRMMKGLVQAFFSRLDAPEAQVANRAIVQLWAEIAINEDVRASSDNLHQGIRRGLKDVVQEAQRRGDFAQTLNADAIVTAMMALYDGFRLQKAWYPDLDTETYQAVVEALLTGSLWTGAALGGPDRDS